MRRTSERELLLSSIVAVLAVIGAQAFPDYRYSLWFLAAFVVALAFYLEVRKPVNYLALEMNDEGFVFDRGGTLRETARWADVVDVYFTRTFNDFSNDRDTEWELHTPEGVKKVLVEGADSKLFPLALRKYVPGFDAAAAALAMRGRKEGRWRCYHAPATA